MSVTINGTSGLVFNDASTQTTAATGFGFKNRLINSAMVIDQRNAGALITNPTNQQFLVDRWQYESTQTSKVNIRQNYNSVTPPVGFTNYLGVVSNSAYSIVASDVFDIRQRIEGFNVSDLAWGTANAQTVTLSFWVRSSLTGTFGGTIKNDNVRSYPFTFTISAANTWEQKSVTIAGDTSGTWSTDNTVGLAVTFGLGVGSTYSGTSGSWSTNNYYSATGATSVVGTSGATFYITGVQLEKGSTATSFDYRPYGTELALCQRYYYKVESENTDNTWFGSGFNYATTVAAGLINFPVSMRIYPTALEQTGTASNYAVWHGSNTTTVCSSVPTYAGATKTTCRVLFSVASGLTIGQGILLRGQTTGSYLAWSAEL